MIRHRNYQEQMNKRRFLSPSATHIYENDSFRGSVRKRCCLPQNLQLRNWLHWYCCTRPSVSYMTPLGQTWTRHWGEIANAPSFPSQRSSLGSRATSYATHSPGAVSRWHYDESSSPQGHEQHSCTEQLHHPHRSQHDLRALCLNEAGILPDTYIERFRGHIITIPGVCTKTCPIS